MIKSNFSIFYLISALILFIISFIFIPLPHGDDIGTFSTGYNIIMNGSYFEFDNLYSHRGVISSIIYGIFYIITNDIVIAHKLIILIFSLIIITSLYFIDFNKDRSNQRYYRPILFLIVPFIIYSANMVSTHLIQTSFLLIFIYLFNKIFQNDKYNNFLFFCLGISLGTYALTHPYSLISFPFLLFFVFYKIIELKKTPIKKFTFLSILLLAVCSIFIFQIVLIYISTGNIGLKPNTPLEMVTWNISLFENSLPDLPPNSSTIDIVLLYLNNPYKFFSEIIFIVLYVTYSFVKEFWSVFIILIPFTILGVFKSYFTKNKINLLIILFLLFLSYGLTASLIFFPRYFIAPFIFLLIFTAVGLEFFFQELKNYKNLSHRIRQLIKFFIVILITLCCSKSYIDQIRLSNYQSKKIEPIISTGKFLSEKYKLSNQTVWTTTKKIQFWNQEAIFNYLPKSQEINMEKFIKDNDVKYLVLENNHGNGEYIINNLFGDYIDTSNILFPENIKSKTMTFKILFQHVNEARSIYVIKKIEISKHLLL